MYRREVPKYVISDVQQEVRSTEEKFLKGAFTSNVEREQVVKRLVFLESKLADFAEGDTKENHLHRAQQYNSILTGRRPAPRGPSPNGAPAPKGGAPGKERGEPLKAEQDEDESGFGRLAESLIKKSKVKWEDIAGLEEAKGSIISSMRLFFMEKPEGIKIDVTDKFLLWGPPGTGKTLLASAAAAANNMTFFEVGVSRDLLSKWVGDSPKILSAVYAKAAEKAPSIIFLDEVTVLVSGGETQHEVSKQLHDTFLTILDGFQGKSEKSNVLTIATTNRPWELSEAMKSRFKEKVYVPLPDAAARTQILKIETKGHQIAFPLEELVNKTNYYSGRDLKNLCDKAIQLMLREANPSLTAPGSDHVPGERIRTLPLTRAHFEKSYRFVPPVTGPDELQKFDKYHDRGL